MKEPRINFSIRYVWGPYLTTGLSCAAGSLGAVSAPVSPALYSLDPGY
jgi:hypothetical protein